MQTSETHAGLFRVYGDDEPVDSDGYPLPWRHVPMPDEMLQFLVGTSDYGIKDIVRSAAEHRCIRCGHPYLVRAAGGVTTRVEIAGEMVLVSPCDERCCHGGPVFMENPGGAVYAPWRILTVHHANGNKRDLRWWNLLALCQRCHLTIQGRVIMERAFIFEHSAWFAPYAAGWYAFKYLGEEITREEAIERQDELLALERLA